MSETERGPDPERAFRIWWEAFLLDWHHRYPQLAPPEEREARECFFATWESHREYARLHGLPSKWERAGAYRERD